MCKTGMKMCKTGMKMCKKGLKMCKKGIDTLLVPLSWWDMFPHQLAHSNEDAWARGLQVFPRVSCSNLKLFHRSCILFRCFLAYLVQTKNLVYLVQT